MGYITDENDNLVYIETGSKKKETQSDFPNLDELIEVHQKEVQRIEKKIAEIDFYKSLINATEEAGGCTDWLTPETALQEIADTLAINNVRFYYKSNNHNRSI